MTRQVEYRASAFHGGAVSYAAQGQCSAGDDQPATKMLVNERGQALRAQCEEHAKRWQENHGGSK